MKLIHKHALNIIENQFLLIKLIAIFNVVLVNVKCNAYSILVKLLFNRLIYKLTK